MGERYDELVKYNLMLEKDMQKLQAELTGQQAAKGIASQSGYGSKLQLFRILAVAFLVACLRVAASNAEW